MSCHVVVLVMKLLLLKAENWNYAVTKKFVNWYRGFSSNQTVLRVKIQSFRFKWLHTSSIIPLSAADSQTFLILFSES